jgi:hypothetical protein
MEQNLTFFEKTVNQVLVGPYSSFISSLPENYQLLFRIFLYTVLIAIYSIFVFEFYRLLARKNIFRLNLSQYNTSSHPLKKKFFATLFFLVEYIVIVPIIVFFWFTVLSLILLLLSEKQSIDQILLISAAVVGAVRITAYFKEDLSRDVAKMFPFTVLAVFLLSPGFFNFSSIITKILEIPLFLNHIIWYLIFVAVLEVLIRVVYTISFLLKQPEEQEQEEIKEEIKKQEEG